MAPRPLSRWLLVSYPPSLGRWQILDNVCNHLRDVSETRAIGVVSFSSEIRVLNSCFVLEFREQEHFSISIAEHIAVTQGDL